MQPDSNSKSKPTCRIVRARDEFIGKQGLVYAPGISAESVGARGIHLQIVTIPPGGRAKAHKHEAHETAIYILSGESGVWHGERLEGHLFVRAGDFLYIPADMPHLPYNPSDTENCVDFGAHRLANPRRFANRQFRRVKSFHGEYADPRLKTICARTDTKMASFPPHRSDGYAFYDTPFRNA